MIRNAVDAALGAICDQLGGFLVDFGEEDLAESFYMVGDDLKREGVLPEPEPAPA